MASKNFTGTLDLSLGSKAAGMRWRFTHKKTTGDVVRGNFETTVLSDTGEYNFDLKFGQIMIESKLVNQSNWVSHGSVVIDENTAISTIPELLVATNPVTEDVILQMQAILQDARDAEASSFESSIEAQDLLTQTQALVENKVDKIEGKGLSTFDYNATDKGKVDALGAASERDVTAGIDDLTPTSLLSNADYLARLGSSDSAWTSVSMINGWTGSVRYIKRGGFVTIHWFNLNGTQASGSTVVSLPDSYAPSLDVGAITSADASEASSVCSGSASAGGSLFFNSRSSIVAGRGSITYPSKIIG